MINALNGYKEEKRLAREGEVGDGGKERGTERKRERR